jgi:predicted phosphoadenosine phosphosulfate sulfurtransferase
MKQKIKDYIKTWEQRCYFDGIPDEGPARLEQLNKIPSYRQICIAILKNDYPLKTLGYTPKISKYYHIYKRIELNERNKNKPRQLTLF